MGGAVMATSVRRHGGARAPGTQLAHCPRLAGTGRRGEGLTRPSSHVAHKYCCYKCHRHFCCKFFFSGFNGFCAHSSQDSRPLLCAVFQLHSRLPLGRALGAGTDPGGCGRGPPDALGLGFLLADTLGGEQPVLSILVGLCGWAQPGRDS